MTGPSAVQAQQTPPKYLQIIREAVKPGRDAAHSQLEAAWSRAFAKAKVPLLGHSSITVTADIYSHSEPSAPAPVGRGAPPGLAGREHRRRLGRF